MITIMTDKELVELMEHLEIELSEAKKERDRISKLKDRYYGVWRSIEDPIVKVQVHKEIIVLVDELHKLNEKVNLIRSQIGCCYDKLHSKPSATIGCIYDTYHEINYDDIVLNGIIGVKL